MVGQFVNIGYCLHFFMLYVIVSKIHFAILSIFKELHPVHDYVFISSLEEQDDQAHLVNYT